MPRKEVAAVASRQVSNSLFTHFVNEMEDFRHAPIHAGQIITSPAWPSWKTIFILVYHDHVHYCAQGSSTSCFRFFSAPSVTGAERPALNSTRHFWGYKPLVNPSRYFRVPNQVFLGLFRGLFLGI